MPVLDEVTYAQQCDTCLHWRPAVQPGVGTCNRHSPTATSDGEAVWPRTHSEDSCGDWTSG